MIGELVPFTDRYLAALDLMAAPDAIKHVEQMLERSIFHRNNYETIMLNSLTGSAEHRGALNAWIIDCNNILRFKKLRDEIFNEG